MSNPSSGTSVNAIVGYDQTPSPQAKREIEAMKSKSVLGFRREMQGCPISILAQKTGISKERLAQLESLPTYLTVTKSESEQIAKVLGSGDLHTALTPETLINERHRL
jgi:hypothetical protein